MLRAVGVTMVCAGCGCGRLGFATDADDSAAGNYAAAVIADSPVAYFRFEETGGNEATSSVGSSSGEYQGTIGFGTPGAMGGSRAVRFDGMTSRIELGDQLGFAGDAPYSLELWLKPSALSTTRFVIDRRTTAMPIEGYTIYLGQDYLLHARYVGGNETSYVNVGAPSTGRWLYVVATWDGSVPRMYLDGVLFSENLGSPSTIAGGAGNFVIGDKTPGQFYKLAGDLDELAIYDYALGDAQIAAHHAAAH